MTTGQIHSAQIRSGGATRLTGCHEAIFPWWSFTKTLIAVAAMRLVEQGKLDLDDRLPHKPYSTRHLMQHRAGVPDYGRLPEYHNAVAKGDPPWSREELFENVQVDTLDFEPGKGWAYSNVGYLLLVEHLTGIAQVSLSELLSNLIFRPLCLESAKLAERDTDFSQIYWESGRSYNPRWVYHGCVMGSPLDAANALQAIFTNRLIDLKFLEPMFDMHRLGGAIENRPWIECGYGLGLMVGKMRGAGRAIGHSGCGPFSVNAVYHFPDTTDSLTIATFTDGSDEGIAESEAVNIANPQYR